MFFFRKPKAAVTINETITDAMRRRLIEMRNHHMDHSERLALLIDQSVALKAEHDAAHLAINEALASLGLSEFAAMDILEYDSAIGVEPVPATAELITVEEFPTHYAPTVADATTELDLAPALDTPLTIDDVMPKRRARNGHKAA